MRKLASIRRVSDILPIKGANAIEVAVVDGWKVVVKKDEYTVGELAVYLEIDSWVPHELAPFLSKGQEPREYNGVKGERLRTVKLRGQVSQGLLLKVEEDNGWHYIFSSPSEQHENRFVDLGEEANEGKDVTELLGIQKWEAPIAPQLAGQVRGQFPTNLIPKTDQERIQNCFEEIAAKGDVTYEVTLKLDGTSCTIFRHEGELRVCSRNLELKVNKENANNTLVAMALKIGDKIKDGLAFQGELMGPGIQGNREGFTEHRFFVFDIFDIEKHEYLTPVNRKWVTDFHELDHVPVFFTDCFSMNSVDQFLVLADGPSVNHKVREGVVFKCNDDPSFSFKVINNQFLLKE
jgi:RNA ligase (TIGR02306 family)